MTREPFTHEELMLTAFFQHENGQVFLIPKIEGQTIHKSDLTALAFDLRGINKSVANLLLGSLTMYQTLHMIRNELLAAENAAADVLPPEFSVDTSSMQLVDLTMALAREGLNATVKQFIFENSSKKT